MKTSRTFPDEENGDDITYDFPAYYVVCWKCSGKGSHVNEAIDGNGFTMEEFHEMGHEFREDYMSGAFDVTCTNCDGKRVTEEINRHLIYLNPLGQDSKMLKAMDDHDQALAEMYQEMEAERRAGC